MLWILAQAANSPASDGNGSGLPPWLSMWPIFAIVLIMYLMLIRPQRKKEKRRQEMLGAIEKKDRVVTIGGIHGVVKNVTDKDVTLLVDEKRELTLKVNRSAIYSILNKEEGELADEPQGADMEKDKD